MKPKLNRPTLLAAAHGSACKSAEEWFQGLQTVTTEGHDCGSFYSHGRTHRVITLDQIRQIQADVRAHSPNGKVSEPRQ